ncbi:hypothetical protein CHS0354_004791 [Potamilus streckersoni]|uniref:Uncharacterized protein n=1 Tax=Potamilus streckersoni TaxID=2493646 RepID=A0AAE0WC53_9BIVA|nr:hypothetical protein CHS0354_004791 [Potamilus streckersoni]
MEKHTGKVEKWREYRVVRTHGRRGLETALLVMTIFAFIFLAIGFAIPDWFYILYGTNPELSYHMSIWYDILCPGTAGSCQTVYKNDRDKKLVEVNKSDYTLILTKTIDLTGGKLKWELWQALSTISVICALIGVVIAVVVVCLRTRFIRIVAFLGFLIMLVSGALMWITVGMIIVVHMDLDKNLVNNSPIQAALKPPSGLIIAAIGAFLAVNSAFMFLYYLIRHLCCGDRYNEKRIAERWEYNHQADRSVDSIFVTDKSRYMHDSDGKYIDNKTAIEVPAKHTVYGKTYPDYSIKETGSIKANNILSKYSDDNQGAKQNTETQVVRYVTQQDDYPSRAYYYETKPEQVEYISGREVSKYDDGHYSIRRDSFPEAHGNYIVRYEKHLPAYNGEYALRHRRSRPRYYSHDDYFMGYDYRRPRFTRGQDDYISEYDYRPFRHTHSYDDYYDVRPSRYSRAYDPDKYDNEYVRWRDSRHYTKKYVRNYHGGSHVYGRDRLIARARWGEEPYESEWRKLGTSLVPSRRRHSFSEY